MESWAQCPRLDFFLFQRKLYILFSISFLIFWNSINVSQLGKEDLVSDYIFNSLRESHSVPNMGFSITFNYFAPFGVIQNRFTKINFRYFNGNCNCSSCPGWWILFLYVPPHETWLFEKIIFELVYCFHIILKSLLSY